MLNKNSLSFLRNLRAVYAVGAINNQIMANAAGVEGKAVGLASISIENMDFGKIHVPNGNNGNQIIISGNNNQITANSAESNSVGIINFGGMLAIRAHNIWINPTSTAVQQQVYTASTPTGH